MRTYANRKKGQLRTTAGERERRADTQWDVSLHITHQQTTTHIIDTLLSHLEHFTYILVGGIERNSTIDSEDTTSQSDHVHIALILRKEAIRKTVIGMCTELKHGKIYCTPRNRNFTYTGWFIHHTKIQTKVYDEHVLFVHGTLPDDELTTSNRIQVKRMLQKYFSVAAIPRILDQNFLTAKEVVVLFDKYVPYTIDNESEDSDSTEVESIRIE